MGIIQRRLSGADVEPSAPDSANLGESRRIPKSVGTTLAPRTIAPGLRASNQEPASGVQGGLCLWPQHAPSPQVTTTLHPGRRSCSDHQLLRGGLDARFPSSGWVAIFAPPARRVRSPAAPRGAPKPLSTRQPPQIQTPGPTANSHAHWRFRY